MVFTYWASTTNNTCQIMNKKSPCHCGRDLPLSFQESFWNVILKLFYFWKFWEYNPKTFCIFAGNK